jgi:hypothetical protein
LTPAELRNALKSHGLPVTDKASGLSFPLVQAVTTAKAVCPSA